MKKYVPIVTDDPQDNVEAALNLVFIKDEEVYVRGYGPAPDFSDATLSNVTRDILQKYSPRNLGECTPQRRFGAFVCDL